MSIFLKPSVLWLTISHFLVITDFIMSKALWQCHVVSNTSCIKINVRFPNMETRCVRSLYSHGMPTYTHTARSFFLQSWHNYTLLHGLVGSMVKHCTRVYKYFFKLKERANTTHECNVSPCCPPDHAVRCLSHNIPVISMGRLWGMSKLC